MKKNRFLMLLTFLVCSSISCWIQLTFLVATQHKPFEVMWKGSLSRGLFERVALFSDSCWENCFFEEENSEEETLEYPDEYAWIKKNAVHKQACLEELYVLTLPFVPDILCRRLFLKNLATYCDLLESMGVKSISLSPEAESRFGRVFNYNRKVFPAKTTTDFAQSTCYPTSHFLHLPPSQCIPWATGW